MKRCNRMSWVVLCGALGGVGAPTMASAQSTEPRADVTVRFASHRQDGTRGSGGSVGDDLAAGESARLFVTSGRPEADGPCGGGGGAGLSADRQAAHEAGAMYVWRFDVKMIEVVIDKITFDLKWERIARASNESVQQTRRLTLREGETYPIDLVHGRPDSTCVSLFLEATAAIREDPALANKLLEWEIWLAKDATSAPVHFRAVGRQGEAVNFAFEPVSIAIGSNPSPQSLQVSGQLRGRVRADGSIEVALDTHRTISAQRIELPMRSAPGPASSGGSGQKIFTMKPDEVVRVVLPPLNARVQITQTPNAQGGVMTTAKPQTTGTPTSASEMAIIVRARVR